MDEFKQLPAFLMMEKENDIIEITFGERTLKVRVLNVKEHAMKAEAASLYEVIG